MEAMSRFGVSQQLVVSGGKASHLKTPSFSWLPPTITSVAEEALTLLKIALIFYVEFSVLISYRSSSKGVNRCNRRAAVAVTVIYTFNIFGSSSDLEITLPVSPSTFWKMAHSEEFYRNTRVRSNAVSQKV